MKRGLIVGKFYPPHAGHFYLIETALQRCDELTIAVCDHPEYRILAKTRAKWLRNAFPGTRVIVVKDTIDDDDSAAWAKLSIEIMDGTKPDIVFTSEDYGKPWSEALGCEHYQVDVNRSLIPCSGTDVRRDPFGFWNYLSPDVKGYFALRVCLVGAESTGKTTLSRALAEHYHTTWVPEYGREFSEKLPDMWHYTWTSQDFEHIARRQAQLEDEAAKQANKVLICDTDVFATAVWHRRYMGIRSVEVEALAAKRPKIDLYIVPDPHTPFTQDGYRDGEDQRQWMHDTFIRSLTFWGKNYLQVSGTPEERLAQATAVIDKLLAAGTGISGKEVLPSRTISGHVGRARPSFASL